MKFKLFLLLVVMGIGCVLRYQHYSTVPAVGDSFDEYSNAWVGISLIRTGVPVGAMGVGGYSNVRFDYVNVDQVFQSGKYPDPIRITWPWFDHPPLMGLVSGGYAYLNGADVFEDTTLRVIRRPMLLLGVISVGLVFLLGWQLYGFWAGFVSGLLYATSPLVVVGSRMVQAENGFIPLFLLAMLLSMRYIRTERLLFLFLAILCAGFGLWFKLSAVAIVLAMLVVLPRKVWLKVFVYYLPFVLVWVGYGVLLGADTFLQVFLANSNRIYGIGPMALFELFTITRITHLKIMTDGWMLSGWLAIGVLLARRKKGGVLLACVGTYLAVFLIFGNYPYGWYMLPFWPFLFIAVGKVFSDMIKRVSWSLLPGLFCLVPIGVIVARILPSELFLPYSNGWKLGMGGVVLSLTFFERFGRIVAIGLFVIAVILNIYYLQMITPEYWFKIF